MTVQRYNVVAKDWLNLEFIINDLTSRVIGQEIGTGSSPTFAGLTISGLTASRLIASDANKGLESVDLNSLITGTAKQITVINDDGGVILSGPQNLATDSSPEFAGMTISGTLDASAGKVLVEDNDTTEPTSGSDGYIGVAKVAGNARIYFQVDGQLYYTSGTFDINVATGNPIGLLLALTYT